MNERIEEQPYDDRHNTPPANYSAEPFVVQTFDELQGSRVHPGGYVGPEEMHPTYVHSSEPIAFASTGLVWRFIPGQELQDIGRTFTNSNALDNMHVVDLRTILAHLDSAARAIQSELDQRGVSLGRLR